MSFALTQREVRALERKKMVLKRDVGGAMFKKEGGVCKLVVLFKCGPSLNPSFLADPEELQGVQSLVPHLCSKTPD